MNRRIIVWFGANLVEMAFTYVAFLEYLLAKGLNVSQTIY